jgi:hypothetical protein
MELFALESGRARSLAVPERLRTEEAQERCRGREWVCLPENLLGVPGRDLLVTPARAMALAVARAPRETSDAPLAATYARASAAEEKLGAS